MRLALVFILLVQAQFYDGAQLKQNLPNLIQPFFTKVNMGPNRVTENIKNQQSTNSSQTTVARNESIVKDPLLSMSTEAEVATESVTQVPIISSANTTMLDAPSSEPVARSQN